MSHDIVEVKPLDSTKLHVRFDDGVVREVDVARLIKYGPSSFSNSTIDIGT
jgi:Protein of unknown function (DUF2442)